MGLVVQKFGGSSVANIDKIFNVANIIIKTYNKGNEVVVVVSAQGDTTDELIQKALEINENPSTRELDVLLSAGEQMSIALLAMAIQKLGGPVVSLLGWQAGFKTDFSYGSARIEKICTRRIKDELEKRNIVIVAGFQGVNKCNDVTTLGRGGSDTSAVAIAAAMHANICQIYTDVDGVYTANPNEFKEAIKLEEISYNEMLELATLGAQVLNNRSVEMAKKYNVELEVLSSITQNPGTMVRGVLKMEKMFLSGVVKDIDVARISVINVPDQPGWAFKLFSMLAAKNINVDVILQSIGNKGNKDISFTVAKNKIKETLEISNNYILPLENSKVLYDENIAKVSIVGAGMETHAGVASRMFEALYERQINIQMISTSEIKISVLIDIDDADNAVKAIHKKFFE